jgi:hypothetical protein
MIAMRRNSDQRKGEREEAETKMMEMTGQNGRKSPLRRKTRTNGGGKRKALLVAV